MRLLAILLVCGSTLSAAGTKLFAVHDGEQCGFADFSGKIKIPARFQDCAGFSEGLAAVEADGRWGYVDESGAAAIPPRFLSADSFSEGLAFVTEGDGAKCVIDRKGKVLFAADYYKHGKFSEGVAPVEIVDQFVCFSEKPEVKSSCADGEGHPRHVRWGYINKTGAMAIPPYINFAAEEFHDGLAYAGGGFIDHRGTVVIAGRFTGSSDFSNGVAAVQVDYKNWGYIDKSGGWLAPAEFDEAGRIEDGRGLVRRDGLYGYVNASGTLVIPLQFENALPFAGGLAAVRKDGKWGYIDGEGKTAIAFQFDAAQSFEDEFATVAIESRTAVIDKQGSLVDTKPATISQTFQRLQGIEVKEQWGSPLDQVLRVIQIYKEQLRQIAIESMEKSRSAAEAKSAIGGKLRAAGIREGKDAKHRHYGLIEELEFLTPPNQPDLLVVLFHLKLAQATDTSLSIFRRSASGWDLVQKVDRNDYYKWEGNAYHIAPPEFTAADANGAFYMLMASDSGRYGNSSCTLLVDLYRVDANFRLEQLFHQDYFPRVHQITLDADGFRLETIEMEDDGAVAGYRVFPYRYEIRGDRVTRVAPIGFDPHDFLGEWGNLPWEEAARWSDPANLDRIREYYGKIRTSEGYFGGEFGNVQSCDGQKRFWQIGVDVSGKDESFYFLIEQKDKWTFFVKDIGDEMREGCVDVEQQVPGRTFQTMFAKPLE
jgi:hypothetical protein